MITIDYFRRGAGGQKKKSDYVMLEQPLKDGRRVICNITWLHFLTRWCFLCYIGREKIIIPGMSVETNIESLAINTF